jgi:hypothetical protein
VRYVDWDAALIPGNEFVVDAPVSFTGRPVKPSLVG